MLTGEKKIKNFIYYATQMHYHSKEHRTVSNQTVPLSGNEAFDMIRGGDGYRNTNPTCFYASSSNTLRDRSGDISKFPDTEARAFKAKPSCHKSFLNTRLH